LFIHAGHYKAQKLEQKKGIEKRRRDSNDGSNGNGVADIFLIQKRVFCCWFLLCAVLSHQTLLNRKQKCEGKK